MVMMIPEVDATGITTTSIQETYEVFGIVAARNKIISEVAKLVPVSPMHLSLIADELIRLGDLSSIEKSGLNVREQDNVLLRAAYSSPISVLQEAAMANHSYELYGIDAMLMMGKVPRIGSMFCDTKYEPLDSVEINLDF